MDYSIKARNDLRNEAYIVDWRSSNPISLSEKLRIFLKKEILNLWENKVIANYNSILDHATVESPAERPVYQECALLSRADQLACTAEVIEDAVADFGRVRGCQRAAARQLNAADYALQQLLSELATAIPALAAETVPQTTPLAVSKPLQAEPDRVAADDDGALAA